MFKQKWKEVVKYTQQMSFLLQHWALHSVGNILTVYYKLYNL